MNTSQIDRRSKFTRRRVDRPSSPPRDGPSDLDEIIDDLFGTPALARTQETYFQVYALVRAALEQVGRPDTEAARDAAEDAVDAHLRDRLTAGGDRRE